MRRSFGSCYSEQAVKVSNSHSPSDHRRKIFSSSNSNMPSIRHDSTTNAYTVKLSTGKKFLVKLTWRESFSKHGFSFSISEYSPLLPSKSVENSIVLRRVRGFEHFESCGSKIEAYWDFHRADYDRGPEPVMGFYIVILFDSVPGLILGDMDHELQVKKQINLGFNSSEVKLVSRCDYFSGNACCYSTRAKFCDKGKRHNILIELSGDGDEATTVTTRNSILSVYVDEKSVIQVKRLKWNFRGSETIFLDGLFVDLMWDLHDWFFDDPLLSGSGSGVFLFRTRSGLDSRWWLEEKMNVEDNVGFSLLICACKNLD